MDAMYHPILQSVDGDTIYLWPPGFMKPVRVSGRGGIYILLNDSAVILILGDEATKKSRSTFALSFVACWVLAASRMTHETFQHRMVIIAGTGIFGASSALAAYYQVLAIGQLPRHFYGNEGLFVLHFCLCMVLIARGLVCLLLSIDGTLGTAIASFFPEFASSAIENQARDYVAVIDAYFPTGFVCRARMNWESVRIPYARNHLEAARRWYKPAQALRERGQPVNAIVPIKADRVRRLLQLEELFARHYNRSMPLEDPGPASGDGLEAPRTAQLSLQDAPSMGAHPSLSEGFEMAVVHPPTVSPTPAPHLSGGDNSMPDGGGSSILLSGTAAQTTEGTPTESPTGYDPVHSAESRAAPPAAGGDTLASREQATGGESPTSPLDGGAGTTQLHPGREPPEQSLSPDSHRGDTILTGRTAYMQLGNDDNV
ncbi:hypothetical protein AURDEDRAFT_121931 [Auricularia subglabra TFB-10046 SS5]|nr:hypothetical protein AURDEDRAFT_121931 [Auricularia subglabra TFB-10046 SS5]